MTPSLRLVLAGLLLAPMTLPAASQAADDPQPIVDLMRQNAGPGTHRPSGAKGRCYAGEFVPSAVARTLSKAVIFQRNSQALIRFSVGGGNPNVPDAARGPNRGLSFRIDENGPGQTEFVMINAPINFARTPQQMFGFIDVRRPGPNGQPDAERLRVFNEANPETLAQGRFLASRPIPGSWVGVNYWGVHAYTLTDASGGTRVIKFKMVPIDGEVNLTDDEARARPRDFLADEMQARIASGRPVGLRMVAIASRPGDPTNDPTRLWEGEDTRPTTDLGTLFVRAAADGERCDGTIFAPTILADGIAGPAEDPMFEIRTPAYAISITKRRN